MGMSDDRDIQALIDERDELLHINQQYVAEISRMRMYLARIHFIASRNGKNAISKILKIAKDAIFWKKLESHLPPS